ncbi:MAG: hypothetical protein U0132_16430 [Gemmatimonadaceae bacterium]
MQTRCLLCIALIAGKTLQAQGSVPVTQEPRHHYAFSNADLRVFDVVVPTGDTTLFHLHASDYAYITFGGAELVAEVMGNAPTPLSLKDGEVRFSRAPLTHRVSNPSARPFHNLTIELLGHHAGGEMDPLSPGDSVVLENDRVRAVRREIPGGATATLDHTHGHAMDVFVTAGAVEEDEDGGTQPVTPGMYRWRDGGTQRLYNVGDRPLVMITITVK